MGRIGPFCVAHGGPYIRMLRLDTFLIARLGWGAGLNYILLRRGAKIISDKSRGAVEKP